MTLWVILMYSQGGITANPLIGLELGFVVIFGSTALSGMVDIGQDFIFSQKVKCEGVLNAKFPRNFYVVTMTSFSSPRKNDVIITT